MNTPESYTAEAAQAWASLWRPADFTSVVPANMQADWYAWFDNIPVNTAIPWCAGTLVKTATNKTFYFDMWNSVKELKRDDSLDVVSKINVFIRNAFRDTYKYVAFGN